MTGVPASPSGLRPFGAEPASQSQAEPLVPNADALLAHAKKAATAIYIAADQVVADDISRTLRQLVALQQETERALRIRIWNECKRLGMRDAAAYEAIKLEIGRVVAASGIDAATADETRSGSAEGESPAPEGGDAQ